ncbi:uncharacterized protein LOC143147309 isoform X2 [Ptiloglossa arizonensis]|uniref:uncharacterized protein LOC143147309 isoform X2 n=1 Tax=Ptiloglossa arizonensis TaxID=3350558 RepID=UPI003F9FFD27
MTCKFEFSRGNGTGVAEAIGNWGFSNNKIANSGQELRRLRYLSEKMACLYDPETWYVKPSPEECKPIWTFPIKRPLITYTSTAEILLTSNLNSIGTDLFHIIPGRSYALQGTDKWYRRGPECCPQPSYLAPQCQKPYC